MIDNEKYYRGDKSVNFSIKNIASRYGFPAIFLTTNIELARDYAYSLAREKQIMGGGFLYEFDIINNFFIHDYKFQDSYHGNFKKLIIDFKIQNKKIVKIKNVIDYPKKYKNSISDLIVIYDFLMIKSFKLIESNVII